MTAPCEICGDDSVVHVTDLSVTPAHMNHFCREHVPTEYARTLKQETSRIWSVPANREFIQEFISKGVGIQPEQARAMIKKR